MRPATLPKVPAGLSGKLHFARSRDFQHLEICIVRSTTWVMFGVSLALSAGSLRGEDLFLAEGIVLRGLIGLRDGGRAERSTNGRAARPDPAFPHAIMKLNQVAVGPDGKIYFASGLDGSVMHLLDGRHEIQSFEFPGQVRDLACTGEEHTVYFSVLPTPQNGERLADGKIYRRDLWEGRPTEVAAIRQADVGGNWWGTFTIKDGAILIATLETPSRIFKLTSSGPVRVFEQNAFAIHGLAAGAGSDFWFTSGAGKVYRTHDFENAEPALVTERRLSDVSLRASPDSPRP
jgi:hypothetical protein